MPVDRRSLTTLAAEQLIDGHTCELTLDVPQRHVHT